MRHGIAVGDVHRGQRRLAALGLDPVVKVLEPADGAADSNDVMGVRQRLGQGKAQTARGTA